MSRILILALVGVTALGSTTGSFTPAQAAPLPAASPAQVGGPNTTVDTVRYRRGYYGGYGYRRHNAGGALFAGAALGLIGGAIAASAAPRYRYYGGYPAYGYSYPSYGYGYAPVRYGYGYPAYGYGGGYGYPAYGW